MYKLLEQIEDANDIKKLDPGEYRELAKEIRACLINNISKTGGHLASNLGVVELTMALHLCLQFPEDKLVWDVGHQSYVHKILTGRWKQLDTIRQHGGLSGFPKMSEHSSDAFDTGHATTSVSVALGYAFSAKLQNKENKVFAVIGDGSMTGGMFFEAVNNAARLKSNMVIILNDNNMSISKNVGAMSRYLMKIRTASQYKNLKQNIEDTLRKMPGIGDSVIDKVRRSKSSIKHLMIPGMFFEDMGLTYMGPVDGHNINEMVRTMQIAMRMDGPVLIHVNTKKGKGYRLAEENPSQFHGIDPFHIRSGKLKRTANPQEISYTAVFGQKMCDMAGNNESLVAITAAMPSGTGLSEFSNLYPTRFFDVGIAEEHAVTFAGALAADGMTPVVAIYSTFLQRSYDQIIHDVCEAGHHVVFAIDRAGIVGSDGETHQGIYDLSYLTSIPDLTVMAPKNRDELSYMLDFAVNEFDGPIAIRYPRGSAYEGLHKYDVKIEYGRAEIIHQESEILLLALGSMVRVAESVYQELKQCNYNVTLVNLRFAKPLDEETIMSLLPTHKVVITLEENVLTGGISQQIAAHVQWSGIEGITCIPITLPDMYIEHGAQEILKKKYGITEETIIDKIRSLIS